MAMDPNELKIVLIGGAAAVGVGLLFVKSSSSSKTYTAPGTGAATAIASAQESDYAMAEQAKIALTNTAAGVYTNSDNNSTAIKLAAISGATATDLQSLAAASTYNNLVESDRATGAANVLNYTEQTYKDQLTGIAAHDTNLTSIATNAASIKGAESLASTQAITDRAANTLSNITARDASTESNQTARILGADNVSIQRTSDTLAHLTADNQAVQQAQAAVQVSQNQADAQKSAASSSMWGNIFGSVLGAATSLVPGLGQAKAVANVAGSGGTLLA